MNKKIISSLLLMIGIFSFAKLKSQDLNLSFESENLKPWYIFGQSANYEIIPDSQNKINGNKSLLIRNSQPSHGFAGVRQRLPKNILGDSIEISAMIKLKDVTPASRVFYSLEISPKIYFNNSYEPQITGTTDWKEYKIKAKLSPEKTSDIFIGIWLNGEGSVWVDEFNILVDGKQLSNEMFTNYKIDFSNSINSGVKDIVANNETIERLSDLGKIWGLLKYRHPKLSTGNNEWDAELFKAINTVVSAKDKIELEQFYLKLLDSLGNVNPVEKPKISDTIKLQGNYKWINDLNVSSEIKNRLMALRYSNFTEHYYYSLGENSKNVIIKNEYPYADLLHPDIGFRLLSLFRYWNIVQYFSPYRNLTDMDWNEVLRNYIPKMIKSTNRLQYEKTIASMLSEIKDAHTRINGYTIGLFQELGQNCLPAQFMFAENKPIITYSMDIPGTNLRRGDILLSKNGKSIQEIQDSIYQLVPSPNQAVLERELAIMLWRSKNKIDTLEIDRNGKKLKLSEATIMIKDYRGKIDTLPINYLQDGIAYIKLGSTTLESLKENEQKLIGSKGIVIDAREYPKEGSLFYYLTPYFIKEKSDFVSFSMTNYNSLGDFFLTKPVFIIPNSDYFYPGKIAILINQNTQSNGEFQTMAFRTAPNSKVFGSQTAGADGNVSEFVLPGNISSKISGIGVYYPDGAETQRIGIIPDYEIKPTIKGIRKGKDEVLEASIKYLLQKN